MDFLKNIAIPQSAEHYHLLVLIAGIISLIFIPYVAFVLGSAVLSVWSGNRARNAESSAYKEFSRMVLETALHNKSVITFFGLIPGFSLVLLHAQMLQSTVAISAGLSGIGFVFLSGAFILLFVYKSTFRIGGMIDLFGQKVRDLELPEVEEYKRSNESVRQRTGRWGIILLLVALFLYSSAESIATHPTDWADIQSLADVIFSFDIWISIALLLSISAGVTGVGILYFMFIYNGGNGRKDDVKILGASISKTFAVVSFLSLPLVILVNVMNLSVATLTGPVFLTAGLAVIFLFLSAHFLYGYFKRGIDGYVGAGAFLFLCGIALVIINHHIVLGNATREPAAVTALTFERSTEEMKSKLGIMQIAMTGEDIYNAKCSACHLFNQKKVGPPYNETIPKYNGDKAKIVAFVMNPVKINPEYPSMPNQGLKPAEADSIVSYILQKVGK